MRELELQLRAYGPILDGADAALTDVVEARPPRTRQSYAVAIAAAIVVALVATLVVGATRSGDGRPPRVITPTPTSAPQTQAAGVLAIGDSVMRDATSSLQDAIPGIAVDAVLSRQYSDAVDIVKQYKAMGALAGTIIVDLGTNGAPTTQLLDDFLREVGDRTVYLVTVRVPRPWEETTNARLYDVPARRPHTFIVDWRAYSSDHPDWFTVDGIHLTQAGQDAFAAFVAHSVVPRSAEEAKPSALDIVNVIDEPTLPPAPLAVAGGKVWIATEARTGATPAVHLEGRDPSTAKVLDTIDVGQEAVFSIAGDGDTLWVAGGGDGGVSQTTVSKVDVRTGTVVFTKTLTGTPCSCPIVAGSAGVWLVGNGSTEALHLSPRDGHVIGRVPFPNAAGATAAMEVRARLVVGLDDGSIAVVDPSGARIEHTIPLPTIGDPPVEQVSAMSAVDIPAVGTDSAIDGIVMRRGGSESAFFAPWQLGDVVSTGFSPVTVTSARSLVWVFGGARLQVNSTHAVVASDFAYDPVRHRFDRVPASVASNGLGFNHAVAIDDTVWVAYNAYDGSTPSIVVVKVPETFPFR